MANVQQQLQNMVKFIQKEAKEKASEIEVKTEEEFTIEKARLVQTQKQKIAADFARREQQVQVDKKMYVHFIFSPLHTFDTPNQHVELFT